MSLQARPRSALVPSTAGCAALGQLHGRCVCCLSSRSLASAHQRARFLLALSESTGSLTTLVDERQLLGIQALSGPPAPVASQRLVCPTRNLVRELHLSSLRSHSCVRDETFDSSSAFVVRNLISTWCTSLRVCVATRVVACRWHCPFQLLWVRSSQPAVDTALLHSSHPDHASRRSGLRSCSAFVFWPYLPSRPCLRVCCLHTSTRRRRCCWAA